jgi:hypothetical protein
MVCCCETLEHLDDQPFRSALREIARVARKYALITVPNDENLGALYTKCPRCKTKFSPYRHVRSFAVRDLPGLFVAQGVNGMKCLAVKGIVPVKVWRHSDLLLRLHPDRLGFYTRGARTVCPRCGFGGYSRLFLPLRRAWSLAVRVLNGLFHPIRYKRTCWLLALYEKA